MSSALDKMVPVFTGSNWQQWHTAMQAYLRAQGQWFVFSTPHPADEFDSWDKNNEKALGNITLRVLLRFHRFRVPVAAERPAHSFSRSSLCGCCAPN